jgi:hypothetical protein
MSAKEAEQLLCEALTHELFMAMGEPERRIRRRRSARRNNGRGRYGKQSDSALHGSSPRQILSVYRTVLAVPSTTVDRTIVSDESGAFNENGGPTGTPFANC